MPKKIPMRRCTGCGEMKEKKDLIRVVRTPEGDIRIDQTGKINGRGAYLCDDPASLRKAQKKRSLQRSLDTAIPDEIFDELHKRWEVFQDG
ncbi:MAG: YlxR family protein [Lachnospiraceae bacterium]|nr:YlxR family protein [Lachnospiraceae bacterium]